MLNQAHKEREILARRNAGSPVYAYAEREIMQVNAMQREPIDSDVIASIGYDAAWRVLEIEYRQTQEIYEYFEVPLEEYTAFRNAESKGTYLNTVFKPRGYRYVRVK